MDRKKLIKEIIRLLRSPICRFAGPAAGGKKKPRLRDTGGETGRAACSSCRMDDIRRGSKSPQVVSNFSALLLLLLLMPGRS